MKNWLYNQTVILSGASSGIGKELVKRLICVYGAKIIGIARTEEKLRALQNELGEYADSFSYRAFDVTDKTAWLNLRAKLERENIKPILLLNNAGVFPPLSKLSKLNEETLRTTLEKAFSLFSEKEPRGEYVLVVEGNSCEKETELSSLTVPEHINHYINSGLSKKDAIKAVAKDRGVPKSEIYKYTIED